MLNKTTQMSNKNMCLIKNISESYLRYHNGFILVQYWIVDEIYGFHSIVAMSGGIDDEYDRWQYGFQVGV